MGADLGRHQPGGVLSRAAMPTQHPHEVSYVSRATHRKLVFLHARRTPGRAVRDGRTWRTGCGSHGFRWQRRARFGLRPFGLRPDDEPRVGQANASRGLRHSVERWLEMADHELCGRDRPGVTLGLFHHRRGRGRGEEAAGGDERGGSFSRAAPVSVDVASERPLDQWQGRRRCSRRRPEFSLSFRRRSWTGAGVRGSGHDRAQTAGQPPDGPARPH